jgi:hypothetical protein
VNVTNATIQSVSIHKEIEFGNIEGYDDIKDIVRRALDAEDNYNLLFIGHLQVQRHSSC